MVKIPIIYKNFFMAKNENIALTIGENIRTLRKEKKMSQEKMAELCGISINTIRNIESGGWPSENSFTSIANVLNVEAKLLLSSKEDKVFLKEESDKEFVNAINNAVKAVLEQHSYSVSHIPQRNK